MSRERLLIDIFWWRRFQDDLAIGRFHYASACRNPEDRLRVLADKRRLVDILISQQVASSSSRHRTIIPRASDPDESRNTGRYRLISPELATCVQPEASVKHYRNSRCIPYDPPSAHRLPAPRYSALPMRPRPRSCLLPQHASPLKAQSQHCRLPGAYTRLS